MVVAMVIVINSMIGGFSWGWLLQLSNYRCPLTLSNYNCTEWFVIYKAADATITFEEIVMVMINTEITVAKILTSRLLGIKI